MNHKRFLLLLLVLVLVLVAPIHTFADPPDDQCPSPFSSDGHHSYSQSRQEATCTDAGSITWVCSDCGKVYTETIPALGHDYVERVDKAATCTEAGHAYWVCSRCSDMQEITLPATGHAWDNGSVTTAATCAAEGVKTFTCIRCGATRTESLPKTGHTPVTVPAKAATCTEAGLTEGSKCSTCGAVLKAQETIAAKGHSWDGGRVTQEATCTAEGIKTFTCSNCGATRTDTFPAKGHTPGAVPAKAATCTEPGLTEGSQCSACGTILKAQETIPAKGHAWDGGVITAEPQGFTPGVKTYTCQNDPSHTYTEPVDPTQSVFNGMSNVIPDFSSGWLMNNPVGDMLHIVTQPQGGVATEESPLVLTVEAAGGEGAYFYHWYREPALPSTGGSTLAEILASQASAVTTVFHEAQTATVSGLNGFYQTWMNQHKLPGVTIAKPATATETGTIQPFNPGQEDLGITIYSEYPVFPGYRYWCVVEDEAGHKATSDKATVERGLYIARQPESKNIYGRDSVALTCVAAGGSGPEHQLYNWFDSAGKLLSDESTYMATTTGNYYCKVFDFGTDEVVDAEMARVYYEQVDLRPVITLQPESVILIPQEDGQYSWSMACLAQTFDGGSEDLQYDWYGKTDAGWAPIASGNVLTRSYDHGTFRCKVTDKRNGAYVSSDEATVKNPINEIHAKTTIIDNKEVFVFDFTGGVPPYELVIYISFPSDNYDHWVEYNRYIVTTREELHPFIQLLPREENLHIEDPDNPGYWIFTSEYVKYYAELTDSCGNWARTGSVSAGNPQ